MDTLFLYNTKTLKSQINTKIFVGDNLITKIQVKLPDNIGGYPKSECEYNLRAIIPEGNLSYMINPSQPYFYITNDITEKAQTVKLMMIITHEGNVIGRTNTVDLVVNEPAEAPDPPLTPREEFDEVIAEQRAEIAEQAETISEQATAIEAKDGQISELNEEITEKDGQITELNTENTRLENLTDTQRETIQNMLDNPPQPKLYTPLEPIIPENETRVYTPPQNYDGFASFVVKGTKLINPDLSTYFKREEPINLTFDQPQVFEYSCYGNSMLQAVTFSQNVYNIGRNAFYNCAVLDEVNFSEGLKTIDSQAFQKCNGLIEVSFPNGLEQINDDSFNACANLTSINLPNSLTKIHTWAFRSCVAIQRLILENGFNCNGLNVAYSTLFTAEAIVSCLEALADRTGQTAYTIAFGSTNINKLTAEQRAIATNKNWNLA